MNTRRIIYLLIIIAAAVFIAVSCSDKKKSEQEAMAQNREMNVDVAQPISRSIVITREYPATLAADKAIDVVARVNGNVVSKHFTDGDKVSKGQVLFTIEDTQYRDAYNKAQAQLQSDLSQLDYAQQRYEAMKKALESDAVAEIDVIQAENNVNTARAAVQSDRATVSSAQTNLGHCTVRALADGRASAAKVEVGDYVAGADSPVVLTTIYDDSTVRALFSIDDDTYITVSDNMNADPSIFDSVAVNFSQPLIYKYTGTIDYVAPDINTSTGTMAVKLKINNPNGELKDGMYANVILPLKRQPNAMLIRDAAISTDQNGKYVYTVDSDNKIVYTPIKIGSLYADTLRVVESGLKPTDRYVTKALLKVRNGMKVVPVEQK